MRLCEDLAPSNEEAVDVLHDDIEKAILAVGEIRGQTLSSALNQDGEAHLVPFTYCTCNLVHQRPGLSGYRAIACRDCGDRWLRFVAVARWTGLSAIKHQ